MNARAILIALLWCSIATPVAASADDDVFQWLERMAAAMNQMNYQGTFVYMRDDNVESMRITHIIDDQGIHERLVSVSGVPREVVRDAKGVRWISGEDHTVLANSAANRKFFPELPLGDPEQAAESYHFRFGDDERIAGHSTRRVDIVPKDQYRYGYSLWLERQSNLLLQWELTGTAGETLARLMFTDLKMGSEVDTSELRAISSSDASGPMDSAPVAQGRNVTSPRLVEPSSLPPGFRLSSSRLQKSQHDETFEHLIYSDGIAAVSIYIEDAEPDSEMSLGLSKLGPTHVLTRELNGELITVLGDVPAATVKLIGESLEPAAH